MNEPRLTVVEDRYINYDDHQVFSVLADPNATIETIAAMRSALVAAVRDAETLKQARELANRRVPHQDGTYTVTKDLIDLLVGPAEW